VDLVDLVSCCGLASSNSPDRLISKHYSSSVFSQNMLDGIELSFNNLYCFILLSLFKGLSKTKDDFNIVLQCVFDFFGDDLVSLLEESPSFRMAQNDPCDINVFQVFCSYLPSVSSKRSHWAILSTDLDVLVLFGINDSNQMQEDWSNDDL